MKTDLELLMDMTGCFAVIDESGDRITVRTPLTGVDNDLVKIRVVQCGEGRYLLHDMGETLNNIRLRGQEKDMGMVTLIMNGLEGYADLKGRLAKETEDGKLALDVIRLANAAVAVEYAHWGRR